MGLFFGFVNSVLTEKKSVGIGFPTFLFEDSGTFKKSLKSDARNVLKTPSN